jgi:hypothetical protein
MLSRLKRSSIKAGLVASVASVALVFSGAAPASAALPGAGAFVGGETPPNADVFYPMFGVTPLCARFNPTYVDPGPPVIPASPLIEALSFTGTFNGLNLVPPFGSATFTSTNATYDASPLGTFAPNTNCGATTVGFPVPGTVTVSATVQPVGVPLPPRVTYNCSGPGSYSRVASAVIIQFTDASGCTPSTQPTVPPTTTPLTMIFTGAEVPCFPLSTPCDSAPAPIPPGSSALLSGSYVQT